MGGGGIICRGRKGCVCVPTPTRGMGEHCILLQRRIQYANSIGYYTCMTF